LKLAFSPINIGELKFAVALNFRILILRKSEFFTPTDSCTNNDHGLTIAVVNAIFRLKSPMDHPSMSEFRLALEPINDLAKATPGFVWSYDNDDSELRKAVHS
jgi:hypothetical protein